MKRLLSLLLLAHLLLLPPAWAAMPTFVAVGTTGASDAAVTPGLPAGIVAGNLLILACATGEQAITVADSAGGTWDAFTNSPSTNTGITLTVWSSIYNGTQTAPTTSDSGDHQLCVIIGIAGNKASGFENITAAGTGASGTDTAIVGATTTAANTLVVAMVALANNDFDFGVTWTNADLSDVTQQVNVNTSSGNDSRLGIVTGGKAAVGAYGTTTNTHTGNDAVRAYFTAAIEGVSGGSRMSLTGVGK